MRFSSFATCSFVGFLSKYLSTLVELFLETSAHLLFFFFIIFFYPIHDNSANGAISKKNYGLIIEQPDKYIYNIKNEKNQ